MALGTAISAGLAASSVVGPIAAHAADSSVVIAYANAVDTLDPAQSNYAQTNYLDSVLYEPLITYNSQNKLEGVLATKYALSPDATSVSITLRSGVTFHDGTPLTATDVKYSLDRYKQLGSGVASFLAGYTSTTVTDPLHLTINLSGPNSLFLGNLTKLYILDAALLTTNAGTDNGQSYLATHDVGTGPFEITTPQNTSGDITVARYPKYWAYAASRPASLVFRRIDESSTEREELQAGTINLALNLSSQDASALHGSSVKVANLNTVQQGYIYFNVLTGPTANVQLRRALQLAFDYTGALAKIIGGAGKVAQGPLPLGLSCELNMPPYKQNLAEAKSMLAKLGDSHLTLTMRFQPVFSQQAEEATLFQSDLKSIGVTLNLVPISFPSYLTSLSSTKNIPQMMLLVDFAEIPNVGSILTQNYGPNSLGSNRSGYTSPQVTKLLASAASTGNAATQCSDYQQAQKLIYNAATGVNLFTIQSPVGYTTNLSGIVADPTTVPVSLTAIRVQ